MFRVLYQSHGIVTQTFYQDLREAYKACIPANEQVSCRRMLNGVQSKFAEGDTIVRVSCNLGVITWIQKDVQEDDPLPDLSGLKIECCECRN